MIKIFYYFHVSLNMFLQKKKRKSILIDYFKLKVFLFILCLQKTLMLWKIEGRRRRGRQRMRWLDGITNSMDMNLSKEVGDGQGSMAYRSPWGHKESDTTELN